jgi:serine/threonine protein kinase
MEANNLFNDRYFLERLLGRGNFSEVWLAKDTKTNIKVALKIYAPATGLDDSGLDVFAREFSLVVNANHKNLLKPLYYDSCDRKPFLVLPFCEKGSIMKEVGKMSEKDAWRLLHDVASGLAWLHNMNPPVIHQDIKPDNVMIGENGDFMITDFGVSTHLKSTLRKSMSAAFSSAGTIAYMAPERFSKDNTPIMANDIYSLGATVYEMLTGDTPFGDDGGLIQMKGAAVPELKGEYSNQIKAVINKCLKANPWERPTAEQLEKYAQEGMQNKKITFADEKTFWQKYKLVLLCIIVLVGIVSGIIVNVLNKHNENVQREHAAALIAAENDSIKAVASQCELVGDSLCRIGDAHDEGFETAYIESLLSYQDAQEASSKLKNNAKFKNEAVVKAKISDVEAKLYSAYKSFIEKADLFADDVEITAEFKDRASKIGEVLDLKQYEEINSVTSSKTDEGKDSIQKSNI